MPPWSAEQGGGLQRPHNSVLFQVYLVAGLVDLNSKFEVFRHSQDA